MEAMNAPVTQTIVLMVANAIRKKDANATKNLKESAVKLRKRINAPRKKIFARTTPFVTRNWVANV
jgi:hypothetical protein